MLKKSLFAFYVAFGFFFSPLAYAADYTVGASGCDYTTIQAAIDVATPGDTITINDNRTYAENLYTQAHGTSADRVILRAGTGYTPIVRGVMNIRHDYFTIDGLEITGGNNGITVSSTADYFVVKNCYIHDHTGEGISVSKSLTPPSGESPVGGLVDNCKFTYQTTACTNVVSLGGKNHVVQNCEIGPATFADAFRPFGYNNTIRNNYVHDIIGVGHSDFVQIFGANGWWVRNIVIEKNTIRDWGCQMWMITVPDTVNNYGITIRNNLYVNCSSSGQSYCPQTYVYNNTFVGCGDSNNRVAMFRTGASGSECYNNIFYNCCLSSGNLPYAIESGITMPDPDYNVTYPTPTQRGWNEQHGIVGEDSLFTDASSNFYLQNGSPAIDAGTILSGFSNDIEGKTRPQGSGWDIGAYEYQGALSVLGAPKNLVILN